MSHDWDHNDRDTNEWDTNEWDTNEWDTDEWDTDEWEGQPDGAACGPCPECGAEIDVEAEVCSACGHWLSTAERHQLWDGGSRWKAALSVGQVVLVVVLVLLFLGSMFGMLR